MSALTAAQTLASDTSLIYGRYIRQTLRSRLSLIFGMLQPMLFLTFFGPLLENINLGSSGDSWQTLVPGLLVQLGLFSAAFAGFGLIMEKQLGVVERLRVTPISRLSILMGRVLRDTTQLLAQSVILVLLGVAFGLRAPVLGVLIGFLFVGVLAISLASLSYAFAMRVETIEEFAPVLNSVNMPAVLLSGVLLPMSLAPAWLDFISHLVPFRYIVEAVRAAFVGDYLSTDLALGALVAVALASVALTLGTRLFVKAGA